MLVRNRLGDGCDQLFGCEDLEVFLVAPMGHAGAIENLAGIFDSGDLLFGKGVSQDIFRQGFLRVPVVSGSAVSGMHAESAVMPGQEFFDERPEPLQS
jgi:hypothetical protein